MNKHDVEEVIGLAEVWYSLQDRMDPGHFRWLERHLAFYFVCTTQRVRKLHFANASFIDTCRGVTHRHVASRPPDGDLAGKMVLSRAVMRVTSGVFASDLGPGNPPAAELTEMLAAHTFAYCLPAAAGDYQWH